MSKTDHSEEKVALRDRLRSDKRLHERLKFIFIDTRRILYDINKYQARFQQKYNQFEERKREIQKADDESQSSFTLPLEWVDEKEMKSRITHIRTKLCLSQSASQAVDPGRRGERTMSSFKPKLDTKTLSVRRAKTDLSLPVYLTEKSFSHRDLNHQNENNTTMKRLEKITSANHSKDVSDERPLLALSRNTLEVPRFVAMRCGTPSQRSKTPVTAQLMHNDGAFHTRLIAWRKIQEDKKYNSLEFKIGKFFGDSERQIARRVIKTKFLKQTNQSSVNHKVHTTKT